jgi:hypothetical protein
VIRFLFCLFVWVLMLDLFVFGLYVVNMPHFLYVVSNIKVTGLGNFSLGNGWIMQGYLADVDNSKEVATYVVRGYVTVPVEVIVTFPKHALHDEVDIETAGATEILNGNGTMHLDELLLQDDFTVMEVGE